VKVLLRMMLRPIKFCSRQEITLADIAPSNSLLGAIGVHRWLYGGYDKYWAQCIPTEIEALACFRYTHWIGLDIAPSKLHSTHLRFSGILTYLLTYRYAL